MPHWPIYISLSTRHGCDGCVFVYTVTRTGMILDRESIGASTIVSLSHSSTRAYIHIIFSSVAYMNKASKDTRMISRGASNYPILAAGFHEVVMRHDERRPTVAPGVSAFGPYRSAPGASCEKYILAFRWRRSTKCAERGRGLACSRARAQGQARGCVYNTCSVIFLFRL